MTKEETIGGDRMVESLDGTLRIKVKDGSKVNRVLVWGDNIFGGLYYPDRPNGEWIIHVDDLFPEESTQECSNCHEHETIFIHHDNYCPNCGARMKDGDME